MKNPNSAHGAGAFRVTSTATFASPIDATDAPSPTSRNERRYYWSNKTNACEPLRIRKGAIEHG